MAMPDPDLRPGAASGHLHPLAAYFRKDIIAMAASVREAVVNRRSLYLSGVVGVKIQRVAMECESY